MALNGPALEWLDSSPSGSASRFSVESPQGVEPPTQLMDHIVVVVAASCCLHWSFSSKLQTKHGRRRLVAQRPGLADGGNDEDPGGIEAGTQSLAVVPRQ